MLVDSESRVGNTLDVTRQRYPAIVVCAALSLSLSLFVKRKGDGRFQGLVVYIYRSSVKGRDDTKRRFLSITILHI